MGELTENLKIRNITDEMKNSFLDYAMSVIVSRAIPDVRDGLKPVHRRILYTMFEDGLTPDKKYSKCAKTVGSVFGKYQPHGDTAVYDSLVRMAQDFSYRYPLIDGHGNFGSIDGDEAAAYRYTESKLHKIAMEILRDINKDTIDFVDNFDASLKEPVVLPSRFPNLLVNGSTGIAVGMATNIPPHNLGEIIDGTIALIDNPNLDILDLMDLIKGPDFPTGAKILGNSGIKKAYETGRGIITVRSKTEIKELKNGKKEIIVSEIPYQINKSRIIEKIAELVREKIIDGITELRDESNREGIKIVLELRRDVNANVVLNNLYKYSPLQSSFGINNIALVDGQPRLLSLKEMLEKYIEHQKVIIIRRTKFDLNRAEKRAHILEGLSIALDNIDEIIKIIKAAKDDNEVITKLMNNYNLSKVQSESILEMKLRRLTGLEREKIENELATLLTLIEELKGILKSSVKIMNIIKTELLEIKNKYFDERRTEIDMTSIEYIEDESLIPIENIIVTITDKGYIKRILSETYKIQNRGGVGIKGMTTHDEDVVEQLLSMSTHDYILFFTNKGKVYRMKGYNVPLYSRQSKGLPIVNLLPLDENESVSRMLKVSSDDSNKYLVFCTKNGIVKRTALKEFDNIRVSGKIAINLKDNDELIAVKKTEGNNEILLASSNGRMVRFPEAQIRVVGRNASGVIGINLESSKCIGCEILTENQKVLVASEKGYGKMTLVDEYRVTNRGTKGVKTINITDKNGEIVSFKLVNGDEDLMLITTSGMIIRISLKQVPVVGRITQGVKLINLKDEQKLSSVAIISDEAEI